ncbi:hypothetical protein KC867_00655 [Candidatus Saccharibacteria bacterium]|nr:hypothetical protein [Candidatus Saccharibacteria bacterium]
MSKAQDYFREMDDDINNIMESILYSDSKPSIAPPTTPHTQQPYPINTPQHKSMTQPDKPIQSRPTPNLYRDKNSHSRRFNSGAQPRPITEDEPSSSRQITPPPSTPRKSRRFNANPNVTPPPVVSQTSSPTHTATQDTRPAASQQPTHSQQAPRRSAYLQVFGAETTNKPTPKANTQPNYKPIFTNPSQSQASKPQTHINRRVHDTKHNATTQSPSPEQQPAPKKAIPSLRYAKRSVKFVAPAIVTVAIIAFAWTPITNIIHPSSPFADVLSANTTFKIYYPTKLPYDYKIETDSINTSGNNVAMYIASDSSGNKITISVQSKPDDLNLEPLVENMTGVKKLNTNYGEILAGKPNDSPTSLMTNIIIDNTWIIMSLPAKTSITDVQLIDIVNSLRS